MKYEVERDDAGAYVVVYGETRTKPKNQKLAEALAYDLNNQQTALTIMTFGICCKYAFLDEETNT